MGWWQVEKGLIPRREWEEKVEEQEWIWEGERREEEEEEEREEEVEAKLLVPLSKELELAPKLELKVSIPPRRPTPSSPL